MRVKEYLEPFFIFSGVMHEKMEIFRSIPAILPFNLPIRARVDEISLKHYVGTIVFKK